MFFVLASFLKRAPRIHIHLARSTEKGGEVLMSIVLPVPVSVSVPVPDFLIFHTPVKIHTCVVSRK